MSDLSKATTAEIHRWIQVHGDDLSEDDVKTLETLWLTRREDMRSAPGWKKLACLYWKVSGGMDGLTRKLNECHGLVDDLLERERRRN